MARWLCLSLLLLTGACRRHETPAPAAAPVRPTPAGNAVDLYVDGVLQRTLPTTDFATERTLASVLGAQPARIVLLHGEGGDRWIRGGELGDFSVKLNRRGAVKLARSSGSDGGGTGWIDLRDVHWLDVRTPASARIPGEP